MASVLTFDLATARSDVAFDIDAEQISVIQVDDTASVRLEKSTNDPIPILANMEICACAPDRIARIFLTNPATAGSLILNVV